MQIGAQLRERAGAVFKTWRARLTDSLVKSYQQRKVPVTYKTYAGIDHTHVVTGAPAADATKWIRGRLP